MLDGTMCHSVFKRRLEGDSEALSTIPDCIQLLPAPLLPHKGSDYVNTPYGSPLLEHEDSLDYGCCFY